MVLQKDFLNGPFQDYFFLYIRLFNTDCIQLTVKKIDDVLIRIADLWCQKRLSHNNRWPSKIFTSCPDSNRGSLVS